MAEGDRLRDLQMGEARHDERGVALGLVEQRALAGPRSARAEPSISSRSHSRTSVATWSLRERAVCRRLPASPTSAVSRRSMLRWTSSASSDQRKRPESISRSIAARPRSIAARSRRVRMPCAAQHAGVGERSLDVILGQPPVEADRGGKALDPLVDGLGEARRPGRTLFGHKNAVKDPYVSMVSIRQKAYPDRPARLSQPGRHCARADRGERGGARRRAVRRAGSRAGAAAVRAARPRCVEPLLLLIVTLLFVLSPLLARAAVLGADAPPWSLLVVAIAAGYLTRRGPGCWTEPVPRTRSTRSRSCALLAGALLVYLRLLTKAHSPGARRGAPAGAAGAHPAALPVQQPERGARADPRAIRGAPSARSRTWRTCSAR